MVSEKDVQHIAELADVSISATELGTFTHQFNAILEYFDILDRVDLFSDGFAQGNLQVRSEDRQHDARNAAARGTSTRRPNWPPGSGGRARGWRAR